jgi:hypothetical protein
MPCLVSFLVPVGASVCPASVVGAAADDTEVTIATTAYEYVAWSSLLTASVAFPHAAASFRLFNAFIK